MADQITQTLGFDASGAIKSINDLIGSLTNLNTALANTADTIKRFNSNKLSKNFGNLSRNLGKAAQSTEKLAKANKKLDGAKKSVDGLNKSSKSLLLSWQTLGRIAIAQGIVRSINLIQNQFSEAIQTAQEFGTALAEAAAISPRGIQNFDNEVQTLNQDLIELSNQFGFDVLDLAEAKYQEFSNQVRGSAESNQLFLSSLKLARISTADTSEAVGALSSVLNSYDLGVESAERVSAALFKTIELGRTRLSDIADQLGNVTPLARGAGISFVELGAALATITRAGVSPSRALTQVRAIINQLTKPTDELAKVFSDVFQVANAEEAIQKFGGLQGLIAAIADQAEGDSSRIAKFFSNIRARNAFRALSQQGELLAENIDKIGEAADQGSTFIDKLLEKFDEQDAVKFTKALNELKNEFLEFAQAALPTVTKGLTLLTGVIDNLGKSLTLVGAGALTLFAARAAFLGKTLFTVTVAGASASASILALGFGIGFLLGELIKFADRSRVLAGLADEFERIDELEVEAIEQINKDAADATKSLTELGKASDDAFNKLQAGAASARDSIRDENDSFARSFSSLLDRVVKTREDIIRQLDQQIEGAEDRRTKNQEEQADVRGKIDDLEFDRRTRHLDDLQKAFLENKRAEEALNRARQTDTGNEGLEERLELLDEAEKKAREAVGTAQGTGNRAAVFRAEKELAEILQEQLKTKQAQQALDDKATAAAEAKRAEEQKRLDDLKNNVKTLKDNLSLFQDGGSLLPEAERNAAIKRAKEAFDAIQNDALSRDDLQFADLLGVTDLALRFNDQLSKLDLQPLTEQFPKAIEEAAKASTAQIPVEFIVKKAEDFGLEVDFDPAKPLEGLRKIRDEAVKNAQAIEQQQRGLAIEAQKEVTARQKLEQVWARIEGHARTVAIQDIAIDEANVDTLEQAFRNIADKDLISQEDLDRVDELIRKFNNLGVGDLPGSPIFGGENAIRQELNKALEELRNRQLDTQASRGEANRLAAEQEQFRNLIELINQSVQEQANLSSKAQETAGAIGEATNAQSTFTGEVNNSGSQVDQLVNKYSNVTQGINDAIAAQQRLNAEQAASNPGGGQPRMFGGPINYLADGGFARGTDTIPAMLSPGEFVMNAKASRRFASQLIAMNAGTTPVYRQEGGPVINNSVNVGDINVNGTADPDATARRVLSEIRREFRRGTSSRFGR